MKAGCKCFPTIGSTRSRTSKPLKYFSFLGPQNARWCDRYTIGLCFLLAFAVVLTWVEIKLLPFFLSPDSCQTRPRGTRGDHAKGYFTCKPPCHTLHGLSYLLPTCVSGMLYSWLVFLKKPRGGEWFSCFGPQEYFVSNILTDVHCSPNASSPFLFH